MHVLDKLELSKIEKHIDEEREQIARERINLETLKAKQIEEANIKLVEVEKEFNAFKKQVIYFLQFNFHTSYFCSLLNPIL